MLKSSLSERPVKSSIKPSGVKSPVTKARVASRPIKQV